MLRVSFLAAFSASICSATTFYVSPQGNDAHAGTAQQPWATLQHSVDTIAPGDTILVEAGVYLGCRIGISGGQSARKILQADAGAHVLVNKPGPKNRHNSIMEVENFGGVVTDWVLSGFEVANSPKYGIDVRVTDRI